MTKEVLGPANSIPGNGGENGVGAMGDPRYLGLYPDLKRLLSHDTEYEDIAFAPTKLVKYHGGTVLKPDGTVDYSYKKGKRLLMRIRGEWVQVMDTCVFPWTKTTVDTMFETIQADKFQYVRDHARENPEVVSLLDEPEVFAEAGFGAGVSVNSIRSHLKTRNGGEIRVADLNLEVAEKAKEWKENSEDNLRREQEAGHVPADLKIKITTYNTADVLFYKLLLSKGIQVDGLLSDTLPKNLQERGVNDLVWIDLIVKLLKPTGVFAFFPATWGATEEEQVEITARQIAVLRPRFGNIIQKDVQFNPPPSYTSFRRPDGAIVKKLGVIVCSRPYQ